ncbi:SWIM zinc finger family protein [Ruegeria lacuscaerulensis]|uniref:SWIM zinc finger family protein n=1 Tax=Ruegeria lacuscaerulensis TaxID=55218 RepID=UPI00147B84A4|nr:SWIM zinc finger family protein [Ruegeria lacuscaerulensis]
MRELDYTYHYAGRSSLTGMSSQQKLSLVADQSDPDASQDFLIAHAKHPLITARSLRAVSDIVGSRFYVPPAMLARILREADPVVTVGHETVRFEGFSACCSTYARLDIDEAALDAEQRRTGTTNVDFGPNLRAMLAQVSPDSQLQISIGPKAVALTHDENRLVERKVPLPLRWLKGFAEVQSHMAGMVPALSLAPTPAQKFLRRLPRSKSDHLVWVSAQGQRVRATTRASLGSVPLRGGHRLNVLLSLAPKAKILRVFVNEGLKSSAWVLDFAGQRLCLVLNADPWRGFSGDGQLLSELTTEAEKTAAVTAQLNWQDRLDPNILAPLINASPHEVHIALCQLAALGRVGYDLWSQTWFHRELPFGFERVRSLNPRLKAAANLADNGAVALSQNYADVKSGDVTHRVRFAEDGHSCTCPWFAANGHTRGPCKHILAVELMMERQA